jgi:hypothetical protein
MLNTNVELQMTAILADYNEELMGMNNSYSSEVLANVYVFLQKIITNDFVEKNKPTVIEPIEFLNTRIFVQQNYLHDLITYKCGFAPYASSGFLNLICDAFMLLGQEYLLDDKTIEEFSNQPAFSSLLVEVQVKNELRLLGHNLIHNFQTTKSKKNVECLVDGRFLLECKQIRGNKVVQYLKHIDGKVRTLGKGLGGTLSIESIPEFNEWDEFQSEVMMKILEQKNCAGRNFIFETDGTNYLKTKVLRWPTSSLETNIRKCLDKVRYQKFPTLLFFDSDIPHFDVEYISSPDLFKGFKYPVGLVLKTQQPIYLNKGDDVFPKGTIERLLRF